MQQKINFYDIKKILKKFQASLNEPYKVTIAGMWACSDLEELYTLFKQISLNNYQHFCDLGSGDGRAVLLASLFTRASGIEIDLELVAIARNLAKKLNLNKINFICADYHQANLIIYDLLFIYPDKPLDWLECLLTNNWSGHLLVYGTYFQPTFLSLLQIFYVGNTLCKLWKL